MASNSLTFSRSGYQPLQYSDALYLATRGSANILNMATCIGALNTGMQADILIVDMEAQSKTQLFGTESSEDIVSKFVFLSDDRNIKKIWVAGKLVKDS